MNVQEEEGGRLKADSVKVKLGSQKCFVIPEQASVFVHCHGLYMCVCSQLAFSFIAYHKRCEGFYPFWPCRFAGLVNLHVPAIRY